MKIWQQAEFSIKKDGKLVYDYTKVILCGSNGELYYAKTSHHISTISRPDFNVDELDIVRILPEHIQPLADPSFTRASSLYRRGPM